MSGVVLEQVHEVFGVVEVVDCEDSEFLGVLHGGSEHEAADSAEAVDSKLD
jgi:hypothetical protein